MQEAEKLLNRLEFCIRVLTRIYLLQPDDVPVFAKKAVPAIKIQSRVTPVSRGFEIRVELKGTEKIITFLQ
ncbi:MAG TPA: hypothetical protein VJH69_00705 [Candidatus Paceibacterota bacterium]